MPISWCFPWSQHFFSHLYVIALIERTWMMDMFSCWAILLSFVLLSVLFPILKNWLIHLKLSQVARLTRWFQLSFLTFCRSSSNGRSKWASQSRGLSAKTKCPQAKTIFVYLRCESQGSKKEKQPQEKYTCIEKGHLFNRVKESCKKQHGP